VRDEGFVPVLDEPPVPVPPQSHADKKTHHQSGHETGQRHRKVITEQPAFRLHRLQKSHLKWCDVTCAEKEVLSLRRCRGSESRLGGVDRWRGPKGGTVLVARYVTGEGAGDLVEVAGADEGVVVEFEGVELGPLQEVVREGGEAVVVQVHLKEGRFSRWGL
jgi:hypothetical protein